MSREVGVYLWEGVGTSMYLWWTEGNFLESVLSLDLVGPVALTYMVRFDHRCLYRLAPTYK